MSRGGRRPNAGRKTNAHHDRLRALAAQAITDESWIKILKGLAEEAEYGNVKCAELLIYHAFGLKAPAQTPPTTSHSRNEPKPN